MTARSVHSRTRQRSRRPRECGSGMISVSPLAPAEINNFGRRRRAAIKISRFKRGNLGAMAQNGRKRNRRGPRQINDSEKLDELNRLQFNDPSKTLWVHIQDLVQTHGRTGKSSVKADVHRLNRKYKQLQYDPARAERAPLRAEELRQEGFVEKSQFFVEQNSEYWPDMSRKGYSPVEQMPDGRWKIQRHLQGLLTYDELCVLCAPYFASIAHLLNQSEIDDPIQADESHENDP